MSPSLDGTTAVITGASKGFGREIAATLIDSGVTVIGLARGREQLLATAAALGTAFIPVPGDATDPGLATRILDRYRPQTLILNAGAVPVCRPLQLQTWETFSENWQIDVRQAFVWVREVLLSPMDAGSTVIAFSSGAAVHGSPLSGGYAGAKSTVRFITTYAAEEARLATTDTRFISVLPKLTPTTELGEIAVAAYARREGLDLDSYLARLGPAADPSSVAHQVRRLVTDHSFASGSYLLPPQGEPRLLE